MGMKRNEMKQFGDKAPDEMSVKYDADETISIAASSGYKG